MQPNFDNAELAIVARIEKIRPHPNADRLELIDVRWPVGGNLSQGVTLVTGKHYRAGDLGVWLRPESLIPGWLAHDLWMVGKKRSSEPFTVREIEIRGVPSPGLWAGQWYRNDSSKESLIRADEMARGGGQLVNGWISWARWESDWQPGDWVGGLLDVQPCPSSSVAEHLLVKQEVADGQNAGLGSTPAAGSNPLIQSVWPADPRGRTEALDGGE